ERLDQHLAFGKERSSLSDLTEDDRRTDSPFAGDQRQPPEQGLDQGRLPASVRACDREALAPAHVEVDRPQPERAALDDGSFECDDDVAGPARRREIELQLPRLPRLLDPVALEPLYPLRGGSSLRH